MKIISRTSTKPIVKAERIVPNAPLFEIINTGNVIMYIDNIPYYPGERFGVDNSTAQVMGMFMSNMMGKEVKVEVTEMTEFSVTFGGEVVDTIIYGPQPVIRGMLRTTKYNTE